MVDVASMILGEFQDSLVDVFGSSFGWLIGHLIVLSVLTLVILSIRNRDHIISESGYGSRNLAQALAVVGMTAAQYVVYTGNLGFPSTTSPRSTRTLDTRPATLVLTMVSSSAIKLPWLLAKVGQPFGITIMVSTSMASGVFAA